MHECACACLFALLFATGTSLKRSLDTLRASSVSSNVSYATPQVISLEGPSPVPCIAYFKSRASVNSSLHLILTPPLVVVRVQVYFPSGPHFRDLAELIGTSSNLVLILPLAKPASNHDWTGWPDNDMSDSTKDGSIADTSRLFSARVSTTSISGVEFPVGPPTCVPP